MNTIPITAAIIAPTISIHLQIQIFALFNCSTLLFYHNSTHNLIFLCLILCNHHLPCPFLLLYAGRLRLAVTDVWLRKGIGFRYLVLPCQSVYAGEAGNKYVKFPYDCLIPCVDGGGQFHTRFF